MVQPTLSSDVCERERLRTGSREERADHAAVIHTSRVSELLRFRADPRPWGRYKTDLVIELNLKTLTCRRADAWKRLNRVDPTVSDLYRIAASWRTRKFCPEITPWGH